MNSTEQTEWVAYVGIEGDPIIQEATEPKPTRFTRARRATSKEIAMELRMRAAHEAKLASLRAFNERPDVQDARAASTIIEFMTCGDGVVDLLAPAEWAELRRRLSRDKPE